MAQHAKSETVSVVVAQPTQKAHMVLEIEFCGGVYKIDPEDTLTIGCAGTLAVEDSLFLHRDFFVIESHNGLWWVSNVDLRIAATVAETTGMLQSWIGPGGQIPPVVPSMNLVFTAGFTMYGIGMTVPDTMYEVSSAGHEDIGKTTIGQVALAPSQYLLILTLAENWLRRVETGSLDILRSEETAQHLGWMQTRFNRKFDNVREKLDRLGVRGLRGRKSIHTTYRRAGLVGYTMAGQLIIADDLVFLGKGFQANQRQKAAKGSRRSRRRGQKRKSKAHRRGGLRFISGSIEGADPRDRDSGWATGNLVVHVVTGG